ncbi:hypothetical protein SISNIDRAFT_288717 [Sistotremastrum niveocremeum HHB9708]|uniref:Zn(2)-C6 fungal-type domain-containing protein n=1 Tax=Sistotremastrum niveocremeum HHB9708 TaxID=1314777 RepID=A0A164YH80_9AGAM|nr:hypothetical protein SISNIDRAFT_288717 [Sistotremastrum niveocremeum HHB9708]
MDQNNNHHDDGQTPPKLPSFRELLSTLSIPDPIVPGHPHSQLPMLSDPFTGSPIGPQKGLRSRIRGSESASPSPDRENYPASAFRSPQSYVSPPKRPGSDRTASMRSPEDLHIVPSNASTSYALSPASYGPVSPSHHHLANAHLAAAQSQVHTRPLVPVDLPVSPPSLPSPSQSHHSHSGVYRSVLQRAYRACAECRLRKVRCNTPTGSEKCQRCIERDLPCGEADATPPAPGSSSINEWSPGTIQGREKRRRLSEDVELQGPGSFNSQLRGLGLADSSHRDAHIFTSSNVSNLSSGAPQHSIVHTGSSVRHRATSTGGPFTQEIPSELPYTTSSTPPLPHHHSPTSPPVRTTPHHSSSSHHHHSRNRSWTNASTSSSPRRLVSVSRENEFSDAAAGGSTRPRAISFPTAPAHSPLFDYPPTSRHRSSSNSFLPGRTPMIPEQPSRPSSPPDQNQSPTNHMDTSGSTITDKLRIYRAPPASRGPGRRRTSSNPTSNPLPRTTKARSSSGSAIKGSTTSNIPGRYPDTDIYRNRPPGWIPSVLLPPSPQPGQERIESSRSGAEQRQTGVPWRSRETQAQHPRSPPEVIKVESSDEDVEMEAPSSSLNKGKGRSENDPRYDQ